MGNVCSEESQEIKVDTSAKSPTEVQEQLFYAYFMDLVEKGIAATLYRTRAPTAPKEGEAGPGPGSPRRERLGVEAVDVLIWHRDGSFFYVDKSLVRKNVAFSKTSLPSILATEIALVQCGPQSKIFQDAATQFNWNQKRKNDLLTRCFSLVVVPEKVTEFKTFDVEIQNPKMCTALAQGFSLLAKNTVEQKQRDDRFMKEYNPTARPELIPPETIVKKVEEAKSGRGFLSRRTSAKQGKQAKVVSALGARPEFETWHGLDVHFENVTPRDIIVNDNLMSTLVVPPLVRRVNDHDKELSNKAKEEAKEILMSERQSWAAQQRRQSLSRESTLRDLTLSGGERTRTKMRALPNAGSSSKDGAVPVAEAKGSDTGGEPEAKGKRS